MCLAESVVTTETKDWIVPSLAQACNAYGIQEEYARDFFTIAEPLQITAMHGARKLGGKVGVGTAQPVQPWYYRHCSKPPF